jgi:hypothetical protein
MKINKDSKQFQRGVKEELKEHPWAGRRGAEKIVEDHLIKHPFMYRK